MHPHTRFCSTAAAAALATACLLTPTLAAESRNASPPEHGATPPVRTTDPGREGSLPAGPAGHATSLSDAVERAWAIARLGALARARTLELEARGRAADSAFAGPPVVGLELRHNLPPWVGVPGLDQADDRGLREVEPALTVPLWLPGQRDAQRRVVERDLGRVDAAQRVARLALAAAVREAAWARRMSEREVEVLRERERTAADLADDVARRVSAGELAPVDAMVARDERLAASSARRDAEAKLADATERLRSLAGVEGVDGLSEVDAPDGDLERHPRLVEAAAAVEAARARLDAQRVSRRDAPSVSASARFGRDAYGRQWGSSVAVGVSVPLDTEARNAPRLAAAGVELAEAEVALQRMRREHALDVSRARIALEAARAAAATGGERSDNAARVQSALERAFRAGERGLPDVLRARARGFEARLDAELARARVGLAVARLNQSLGVEP